MKTGLKLTSASVVDHYKNKIPFPTKWIRKGNVILIPGISLEFQCLYMKGLE